MKKLIIFVSLYACLLADQVYSTLEAEAIRHAKLSLQAQGVITQIFVSVGSKVKKGDLLLLLASGEQKALLATAKADETLAKNRYERALAIQDTMSKDEFEAYEANYKRAEAQTLYYAEVVANRELRAPFDGVIARKFVEVGDLIERSNDGAFELVDNSSAKLILSFDQRYLPRVATDQTFVYKIDGETTKRVGKIAQVYPTIDKSTRKAQAEVITTGVTHGIFGDGYIEVE